MEGQNKISTSQSQYSQSTDSSNYEEIYQEFCNGNYENLKDLADSFTLGLKLELTDVLIEIAEATDKDRELMDWAISHKIQRSKRVEQLFEEEKSRDDIESVVFEGMKMRFGCVRWLSLLIKPTVDFLKANETGDSDQLKAVDDLLSRFTDSALDVPIWLRQSCLQFKQSAASKFGCTIPNPLLSWFLSPALLGAIEGETKKYDNQIRAINSLILLIGGTKEITDQKTKEVVERKREELKAFEEELFDAQSISLAQSIINSSKPPSDSTGIFLLSKSRKLSRLLQIAARGDSRSPSFGDGKSNFVVSEKDIEELHKKMDSTSWKHEKTYNHGIQSFLLKSDESKCLASKSEFRIKGKLVDVANFVSVQGSSTEYDQNITYTNTKSLGEGSQLIWGCSEMPWPIADRYFSISSHEVIDSSKNMITVIIKNAPFPGGPRKDAVMSKILISGYRFVQDPNDPDYVFVSLVLHLDPGGLFPIWLVNRNTRRQANKVPKLVEAFLKTQGK